jgi:hypothetical protein
MAHKTMMNMWEVIEAVGKMKEPGALSTLFLAFRLAFRRCLDLSFLGAPDNRRRGRLQELHRGQPRDDALCGDQPR